MAEGVRNKICESRLQQHDAVYIVSAERLPRLWWLFAWVRCLGSATYTQSRRRLYYFQSFSVESAPAVDSTAVEILFFFYER